MITDRTVNANLFLTNSGVNPGEVGIAWLGSICLVQFQYRSLIVEYVKTDINTAEVNYLLPG